MDIELLVAILRDTYTDQGAPIRARGGDNALGIAQEMQRFLDERLQQEPATMTLWQQFKADPQANVAELIGELEALVEADQALAKRLAGLLSAYDAQLEQAPPTPTGPDAPAKLLGGDPQPDEAAPDDYETYEEDNTYLYGNVPRERNEPS